MQEKRSIIYRKPDGNHGIIYDGTQVPNDRGWSVWSPQVIPKETIETIQNIEKNVQDTVNKLLSHYLP